MWAFPLQALTHLEKERAEASFTSVFCAVRVFDGLVWVDSLNSSGRSVINAIKVNQSNRAKTPAISGFYFGLEQQEVQLYELIPAESSYSYDLPSAGLFMLTFLLYSVFFSANQATKREKTKNKNQTFP